MAQEAIEQATRRLIDAIHISKEYAEYQALKETVMSNDTNRVLLAEYQKTQTELQVTAISGKNADEDAVRRFSRLSSLLSMNDEMARYLLAQLRVQKLTGEICRQVMDAAGLELQFPGM